jgi:para-nitrobenzyl esterase
MRTLNIPALGMLTSILVTGCQSLDEPAGQSASGPEGASSSSASAGSGGGSSDLSRIATEKGPVQGAVVGDTRVFLGVPYAAPPVGDLRWKPPVPAAAWTEPLDATAIRPACPQIDVSTSLPVPGTSEDCLTLNIWTPASPPASPAPILFWIHGGGFALGSGGEPSFDGRVLSEATGAVVVTINYRLGPLGFLAHRALVAEDPAYPSTGMYGFEDQRAALEWVKTNIAAFGGDPKNVTLFGESAGGISTCLHILSPRSEGLFHRAIVESGPCTLGTGTTEKEAEALGDMLTDALQCTSPTDVLACLRSKTADEVLAAIKITMTTLTGGGLGWYPIIDGLNIPDSPAKLLEAGSFSKVPTLLGSNKDEGTVFFAFGDPLTEAEFEGMMEPYFPGHGAEIVAQYPSAAHGSVKDAAEEALGDGLFVCPTRATAKALSKAGAPTYLYHFVHEVKSSSFPGFGAFHSSEIPFIFGNPYWDITLGAEEQELAKVMRGYWSRMAKSGDPNSDGAPAWPKYDAATDPHLVLDLSISTSAGLKTDLCDFWAGLAP